MFNKLLITMMLIASTQSFAGQDGNGGFGLQCGGKIQLLDLYEAKELYKLNVDLGPANASVDQKVELMLKRMERISPIAAKMYREKYANLWNRAMILEGKNVVNGESIILGETLGYTADIGSTILPTNCKLLALARNLNNDLDTNIYFFGIYWKLLDNDTKAALILHELVYFDLNPIYFKDSSSARKLIAILSSREADTLPLNKLFEKYYGKGSIEPAIDMSLNGYLHSKYFFDSELSDDGTYFKVLSTQGSAGGEYKKLRLAEGDINSTWFSSSNTNYNVPFIDKETPYFFTTKARPIIVGGESYTFESSHPVYVNLHNNKVVRSLKQGDVGDFITSPSLEKLSTGKEFSERPKIKYVGFNSKGAIECIVARNIHNNGTKVRVDGKWVKIKIEIRLTVNSQGKFVKTGCDQ